jgi:gliding motility-associated-like protein
MRFTSQNLLMKLGPFIARVFLFAAISTFPQFGFSQVCNRSQLPANLQTGLVAYYPFCGFANDASGNGFNGTVNGATLTTDRFGLANSAYSFNGASSSITVNGNAQFASSSMTISTWVSFNQFFFNGLQYLVLGNSSGTAWACTYRAGSNANNLRKNQGCGTVTDHNYASNFSLNTWHHVVYVITNATVSLYINGNFISSQASAPFLATCNSYQLNFGLDIFSVAEYLDGKMDDTYIYNRALDVCEITQLYNATSTSIPALISAGTLSGIQNVCVSGTTSFSSTVSGGVWSSSNTSVATINPATGLVTGVSAGTATMTYTVAGSGSCPNATATRTATVTAPPNAGTISTVKQLCTTTSLPGSLQSGLISYYPLCNSLADVSGGSSLTNSGATVGTGPFGYGTSAYFFNGTNTEMSIPYQAWYGSLTNNFTFSFWIKNDLPAGHTGAHVLWRSDGNFTVGLNSNNTINFNRQGSVNLAISTVPLTSTWTHVVMIKSGSSNKIYINGVLNVDNNNSTTLVNTVGDAMIVGRASPGGNGGAYRFNGGLSQLMFYSRVLSATEISTLYSDAWNTVCAGSTSTLTSSISGGTWSSSDPTIATINSTTGALSAINGGTATITYTVPGSGGCSNATATRVVTVSGVSATAFNPLSDTTRVCGVTSTLDAGSGFASYSWNTGASTQTISPTASGFYKVTVTSTAGCAASDSTYLSLVKANIINNDTTICKGSSVTLSIDSLSFGQPGCSVSVLSSNLRNGLAAYYPFCGNTNDVSINSNNANTTGVTLTTDRKGSANSAYSFSGASSYMEIPPSPSLSIAQSLSISFWAYPTSTNAGIIVDRDICNPNPDWSINWGSSKFGLRYGVAGTDYFMESTTPLSLNTWYHVLVVRDFATSKIIMYINGVLNNSINFPASAFTNTSLPIHFGAAVCNRASNPYFNGKLDDVMIWSRALSASEAQIVYNNQSVSWSSGSATTNSITVSPTQTTTYYVTVSDGITTCTDSVSVTVSDIGTFNPLSDTTRVCGTTTTFNAGSGYNSYSWNTGATTQSITPTTSGFYKVTVTNASGCSTSDSTYLSLVNANILNNDTTICSGTSLTLSADTSFSGRSTCNISDVNSGLRSGLLAYWPFCGNLNDASGNNRNGTNFGATSAIDRYGVRNSAMAFNLNALNGQYITVPGINVNTPGSTGMSLSLWIKRLPLSTTPSTIFRQEVACNFPDFLIQSLPSQIETGIRTSSYVSNYSSITADTNWHLVTMTYDKSLLRTYYDANLLTTQSRTGNVSFLENIAYIGLCGNNVSHGFSGYIDDIGMWDRPLTTSEILNLRNGSRASAISYLWSTGASTPTISVNPTQSTTYYVTVSDGITTCTDSVRVNVTPLNTASAASSSLPICINVPIGPSITHTTTGATGIGAATGLPPGVTASWATNTITISGTPTASGTFSYSIPLTGGCGTVSATGTITVRAVNTVSVASSTPSLCINTSLTPAVTHTTTGATGIGVAIGLPAGVTASWASNIITISGTPTASGTFTYSIPLTGGCGTVNATGTITVRATNTVSAASSTPTLCINTLLAPSVTHTTAGATGIGAATGLPPGVTASWASNTITISGTPTASGTFTYSIPLTGGCGTVNATGTITVFPSFTFNPLSDTTSQCGTSKVLDAGPGFASYSWNTGETTQSIPATTSGFYKVTVTNAAGCTASDSTYLSLVNANIINNDTTICKGSSITLSIDSLFPGRTVCNANQLPANLRNGLVGYWPFCGNANDESGNGNNGVVNGAVLASDRFATQSSAYLFNGQANRIVVSNSTALNPQLISVGAWVRPRAFGPSEQYIINKSFDVNSNISARNWGVRVSGDGKLTLEVKVNGQYYIFNDPVAGRLILNDWNLIVFTYDGITANLYCNSILAITQPLSGTLTTQTYALNIGYLPHPNMPPFGYFWNGEIDDVFIYNRCLSQAELQQFYNARPSVTWSPGGATTNSITVTPTQTTTYYVTVTDGITTCTDSVKVTVSDIGVFNPLSDTTRQCGTSKVLDAGSGYASYSWNTGATIQTIPATTSGFYKVIVTNAAGCTASDSTYLSLVNANILNNDTTICKGSSITLSIDSLFPGRTVCNANQLPANLRNGLVGYWPFCGNANDASGNGNNGTINLATLTTDRFGSSNSSYFFNGSSYIVSPNVNIPTGINSTVSFWRYSDFSVTHVDGVEFIALGNQSSTIWGILEGLNGSGIRNSGRGCSGSGIPLIQSLFRTGTWDHYLVVYDDSGVTKVYRNGILFGQQPNSVNPGVGCNSSQLYFGVDIFSTPNAFAYFRGKLDDIIIWNRSLSPAEAFQVYSSSLSVTWSTGATTNSITVSPTQTTTYYVTVTDGITTCTDSVRVTVSDIGAFNPLSDTTRVCGKSTSFDAGSGYASYLWNNGATIQTIPATTSGFYKVTVTNAAGCTASDSTYLSLVNANIINNDTTICKGSSITLSIDSLFPGRTVCNANQLPANLRNGLVGYWPFCGNANDESGNGNNGTVNGATLASDRFSSINGAYQFNGTNSYIDFGNLDYVSTGVSGEYTVSFWLKMNAFTPQAVGGQAILFGDEIYQNNGVIFQMHSQWGFGVYIAGTPGYYTMQLPPLNQWQFYTVTQNASGIELFINGVYWGRLTANTNVETSYPTRVGYFYQIPSRPLDGVMDDIIVHNRRLTNTEISSLFNSSSVTWSTGATTNSITVSPTQTTTYYVIVTDGITTCTDSVKVTVSTVDTTLTLLDPPQLCATGGQVRMQAGTASSYQWLLNGTAISGATSQTYNATQSGTYRVALVNALGCRDTSRAVTITVNPNPTVNAVNNAAVCNGANFAGINFSGSVVGTVYNWTNSNPAIGLAASGTGNLPSFPAVNTGTTPVTATITVTPSYTSNGLTCTGTPITFTITVNPTPTANAVNNQTLCNGVSTTAISFSGAVTGTVYSWTNNTPSIGLAVSGTGNIASFTALNSTAAPITATITVTPSYANGGVTCTGTAQTFTITVNPTPTVTLPSDQTICNGANTTAVAFSGAVTGTVYSWTNNTTSIGLAASGTGNIASFAAVNTGTTPVTATITVTPSFTNSGVTCTGTPRSFTITVNPTPTVNAVSNQSVCNGAATTAISFSGAVTGTVYGWTNTTTSIGLAASGTGNIASFTALNSTAAPITATITVTPNYTNGSVTCTGTPRTFTITVNPTPTATLANPGTSVICQGSSVTLTASGGSTYQWFLNGNIIPGATAATYPATLPGIYTVIPISAFSCTGTVSNAITLSLISRPTADFSFDKYCAGFPTNFTNLSQVNGSGVVGYAWSFGDGNTSTLVNPSNVYAQTGSYSATLLVTPLACPALTSTITKPVVISPPPANIRYPSLNAVTNRNLQLQARLFTGAGYQWIPSVGLNNATIQTPIFNYNQQQQYLIRINTTEGCVITDTLLVRMFTQREIYLPTTFSPNGDGANDVLIPRLVGIADLIYFRVYDRWGQLMYQTTQENQGWDGIYKGTKQPMETYAWMAEGKDIDGNIIKRSGTTILLR